MALSCIYADTIEAAYVFVSLRSSLLFLAHFTFICQSLCLLLLTCPACLFAPFAHRSFLVLSDACRLQLQPATPPFPSRSVLHCVHFAGAFDLYLICVLSHLSCLQGVHATPPVRRLPACLPPWGLHANCLEHCGKPQRESQEGLPLSAVHSYICVCVCVVYVCVVYVFVCVYIMRALYASLLVALLALNP